MVIKGVFMKSGLWSFSVINESLGVEALVEVVVFVRLWDWCFSNKLLLNPEKTKLVVFESR